MRIDSHVLLFVSMVGVGVGVGIIFPYFSEIFVTVRPGFFVYYRFACVVAGLMVGWFNYYLAGTIYCQLQKEKVKNRVYFTQAYEDELTGLFNRRALQEELVNCAAKNKQVALIFLDIDNFSRINNIYGHEQGDAILAQLAAITNQSVRNNDKTYRYGGEEFVLFLTGASKSDGYRIAQKIRQAVETWSFMENEVITVSLGVAAYPDDGDSISAVLREADRAMLQSKKSGKNQVSCANN